MEKRVEPGAEHHSLGWPGEETTLDCGQDQHESRGHAEEVHYITVQQTKDQHFSF